MRKLIFKTHHFVQFFDYHISLSQLLLRSSYWRDDVMENLDILFMAVQHLQTTIHFDGFQLYEGSTDDIAAFANTEDHKLSFKVGLKLYVIISQHTEYYLIAGPVRIQTNHLPVDQTSIDMKKDWYKG